MIAGITSTSSVVTVTTETPHKLSVNDVVRLKNVRSSANVNGTANTGFNGLFTVTGTPSSKVFTFASSVLAGTFTDSIDNARRSTGGLYLQIYQYLKEVNMIHHIQYKK